MYIVIRASKKEICANAGLICPCPFPNVDKFGLMSSRSIQDKPLGSSPSGDGSSSGDRCDSPQNSCEKRHGSNGGGVPRYSTLSISLLTSLNQCSISSTGGRSVCARIFFDGPPSSSSTSESSSASSITAGSAGLSPCALGS